MTIMASLTTTKIMGVPVVSMMSMTTGRTGVSWGLVRRCMSDQAPFLSFGFRWGPSTLLGIAFLWEGKLSTSLNLTLFFSSVIFCISI